MIPEARRCRLDWYDHDGNLVHTAISDTRAAMTYKRWIREGRNGLDDYSLSVSPLSSPSDAAKLPETPPET